MFAGPSRPAIDAKSASRCSPWGYVDLTGKMVIEPRSESAREFPDGRDGRVAIKPTYANAAEFSADPANLFANGRLLASRGPTRMPRKTG